LFYCLIINLICFSTKIALNTNYSLCSHIFKGIFRYCPIFSFTKVLVFFNILIQPLSLIIICVWSDKGVFCINILVSWKSTMYKPIFKPSCETFLPLLQFYMIIEELYTAQKSPTFHESRKYIKIDSHLISYKFQDDLVHLLIISSSLTG